MTSKELGLILITTLLIFIRMSYSNPCNTVYICCKKIDFDCVEYCEPIEECPGDLLENTTSNSNDLEGINRDFFHFKVCRRGYTIINGMCKRILTTKKVK